LALTSARSRTAKPECSIQHQQLAPRYGNRVGDPRAAIEHRHLAENLVPADEIQHDLVAAARRDADPNDARHDGERPGRLIALPKQQAPGGLAREARPGGEPLEQLRRHAAEEVMAREEPALVGNVGDVHGRRSLPQSRRNAPSAKREGSGSFAAQDDARRARR
jgi:hypothetical protein